MDQRLVAARDAKAELRLVAEDVADAADGMDEFSFIRIVELGTQPPDVNVNHV
jgi:hypothetical protein